MTASIRRATSLRPGHFKHLIRVASVTGRLPERDVMLLWLTHTHTTGIRVTELALLEVADVLYPSGVIKPEVYLRVDITKGCRPRNVYPTHPRCVAALKGWIAVRLQRRWGLSGTDEYRGLRPGSKLVTTHKGQAFELAFKHRQLDTGPEVYRACDSLPQTISRLYRQAGIKQRSSHSGRRSVAAKVLAATGDVETVQTILGHACVDHSKPYLTVKRSTIRLAFEIAL
ncbi:tyrosine-type recombinase/integrase [Pseudomonas coronafaciens]|uniref:tyrosine-type recombinase/integrase n=1 Tax=Pseudomonas coronafaciens TaxID=53409 RepID=UPI001CC1CE9D|nr:tyrosine-type recombinase/integrase [Pseudomonas coronafaciens]